jgi:hypothetical protein
MNTSSVNTSMDRARSAANGIDLETTTLKLLAYCRANDWAGYEPYDASDSRIFAALPFLNTRLPRLVLTQALKRFPINTRPLFFIRKTQNPKAIALFLSSFVKLANAGIGVPEGLADLMIERLIALRSQGIPYWCWGYSFSWQGRAAFVPAGAPNLVCTYFAANALLDAYEQHQDSRCLSMAVSAAEYILNELYWTDGGSVASFCYPVPTLRSQTHNANLLAAALMCRVHKLTGEGKFLAPALKSARFSASRQHADGGWDYGEAPSQRWIDNFHTGYNLCALQAISEYAETVEFDPYIRRGFEFYRSHFFREDGAVRYFHNRTYPIDIHSVAQAIITLLSFKDLDPGNVPLAHSLFRWAMDHMWNERGYFYFRILRLCTNRISYLRWSQAWMLLAMSWLLSESGAAARHTPTRDSAALPSRENAGVNRIEG